MKQILKITCATLAFAAFGACGNQENTDRYDYDDRRDSMDDQPMNVPSTTPPMTDDTAVADTVLDSSVYTP